MENFLRNLLTWIAETLRQLAVAGLALGLFANNKEGLVGGAVSLLLSGCIVTVLTITEEK